MSLSPTSSRPRRYVSYLSGRSLCTLDGMQGVGSLQFFAVGGYMEAEGGSNSVVEVLAAVFLLMWIAVIAFLIFDRVIGGGD